MREVAIQTSRSLEEKSRLAMKGFFGIIARWDIDNEEARIILGSPSKSTFHAWKRGDVAKLQVDTLKRIGYVAGIYKALELLYSDPALGEGWIKRPNRAFGDETPLRRMIGGDVTDLAAVRTYLDAARAPWS